MNAFYPLSLVDDTIYIMLLLLSISFLSFVMFCSSSFFCFLSRSLFFKQNDVRRMSAAILKQNSVVDKAARGGETVLKHLENIGNRVFPVYSVRITMFYTVFGGVFPSKQREKWVFFWG